MWKYYEIVEMTPENLREIERRSGVTYWVLRRQTMHRIIDGEMRDRYCNILYYIRNEFNKALREKNVNLRVVSPGRNYEHRANV